MSNFDPSTLCAARHRDACICEEILAAYKQGWTDAPNLDEKNHRGAWRLVDRLRAEVERLTAQLLATESAVVRTITNESERHPVGCECLLCGVLHAKPMTAEESAAFYEIVRSKFKPIVDALPMNEAADDEVSRLMAPTTPPRPITPKPVGGHPGPAPIPSAAEVEGAWKPETPRPWRPEDGDTDG